ncbi:MAG: hypothetical protein JSS02_05585 [Planctomycetes bacterium]|nr:hypothetical protein [Planctomycetota bacterium]
MRTQVTINDPDRQLDYTLQVGCDYLPGAAPYWNPRDGGDPGCSAAIEIHDVRCVEVAVRCGAHAVSAFPRNDPRERLERTLGDWCFEHYREEIEQALVETCGELPAPRHAARYHARRA